jgi:pimeloyl-ACP methyl ester carboxylesterase
MTRAEILKLVRRIWVSVGLTAMMVFTVWSLVAYRSTSPARASTQSDARVTVTHEAGAWSFQPASSSARRAPGLLFFAGSLVDPRAYAPLARAAAEAGYPAFIVELPRRGAFGGADDPSLYDRAQSLMRRREGPSTWIVGGHSRGAVVAVTLASRDTVGMAGLLLIGTSHPRDVDLSALRMPVTKVVGTRDGLASPEEVRANQQKLPPHTRWVWVDGGNHSQFGWYGFQPGDRFARISRDAQQQLMLRAMLASLANNGTE